jgi:hypothetical protein
LASELTGHLRAVVDALPPATPADARLAARLADAADVIDRVAGVA